LSCEANALYYLAGVRYLTGDHAGGLALLEQTVSIFRSVGDRLGESNALYLLGAMRQVTGDYPAATGSLQQALDIFRSIGDRHGEANTRLHLGIVQHTAGDQPAARTALEMAQNVFRLPDRWWLAGIGSLAPDSRRLPAGRHDPHRGNCGLAARKLRRINMLRAVDGMLCPVIRRRGSRHYARTCGRSASAGDWQPTARATGLRPSRRLW
jgi:tetratricopeptide (TPR) repeat protein